MEKKKMASHRYTLCLGIVVLVGMVSTASAKGMHCPITQAESVLAIYVEDNGRSVDGQDRSALILAIWPDGEAVWSEDGVHGGAPYRRGKVAPEKFKAQLEKCVADGLFALPELTQARVGSDSTHTTLLVKSEGKECALKSWHELFEANGKTVATDHGIAGLDGESRLARLGRENSEYVFYRLVWSELQLEIRRLLPTESDPVEGIFVRGPEGVAWVYPCRSGAPLVPRQNPGKRSTPKGR